MLVQDGYGKGGTGTGVLVPTGRRRKRGLGYCFGVQYTQIQSIVLFELYCFT